MKRILVLLIMMLGLVFSSVMARDPNYIPDINQAEINLGGISLGASMDDVRAIYGNPTTVRTQHAGNWGIATVWTYGDSFTIEFSQKGRAYGIETSANNGIKTVSGFTVGKSIWTVKKYFGDGLKYVGNNTFSAHWKYLGMKFTVDKNNKITNIFIFEMD